MSKKTRIAKWDNVKFILILCVVVGHFADACTEGSELMQRVFFFLYLFHMPAFLFVSGMFMRHAIERKNIRRIASWLLFYLVAKLLIFAVQKVMGQEAQFSLFTEGGIPWYMWAMFVFSLVTLALVQSHVLERYALFIVLCFAAAGCAAGYIRALGDFLCLQRLFAFYPFFLCGYLQSEKELLELTEDKTLKIVSAVMLVLVAVFVALYIRQIYPLRALLTGRNPYTVWTKSVFGGIYRLLYYPVSALLAFFVFSVVPAKKMKFTLLGRRTLQVYLLHGPFLLLLLGTGLIRWMQVQSPAAWGFVYLGMGVLLAILLCNPLFEKPFRALRSLCVKQDKSSPDTYGGDDR